jgi:hypothetical protein
MAGRGTEARQKKVREPPPGLSGFLRDPFLEEADDMASPPNDQFSNASAERPVVTTENRARQGVTGHGVRYVLGWGLAGIVIAFAVLYFVFFTGH